MKAVVVASLAAVALAAPVQPHLAQAWTALSSGDGLPGQTGTEHYIYERDVDKSPGALNGHVFDYGAACKKIELDAGNHWKENKDFASGTYYLKCDTVDCCWKGKQRHLPPNVKKWDIAKPGLMSQVKYVGLSDTTELNNKTVKQAERWQQIDKVPFTKLTVTYDYYITRDSSSSDVISHRIDFTYPGGQNGTHKEAGTILYGNFQVQHNMTEFRNMFKVPPQCQKANLLKCESEKVESWERKYFRRGYATTQLAQVVV